LLLKKVLACTPVIWMTTKKHRTQSISTSAIGARESEGFANQLSAIAKTLGMSSLSRLQRADRKLIASVEGNQHGKEESAAMILLLCFLLTPVRQYCSGPHRSQRDGTYIGPRLHSGDQRVAH
jgi:hypothetical protein